MVRRVWITALVGFALAFGLTPSEVSIAAAPQGSTVQGAASQQGPGIQEMMKMHEQMMAELKATDARLEALLKAMNAAAAAAKVPAMAAVVNELVQQHRAMHGRMGAMHPQMMMGPGKMMRR